MAKKSKRARKTKRVSKEPKSIKAAKATLQRWLGPKARGAWLK